MKKRLLSTLLALCMVLTLLPVTAHAADVNYAVTGGNLRFDAATGTITRCDFDVTEAVIPSEIYGIPVTSIGDHAFSGCGSLTSVTIPSSVTTIGWNAFWNCGSLTSVTIPGSVTTIGTSTFLDCTSLTSVSIPNSITSIGYNAFCGCSSLTSVTIPNSVTTIGNFAFSSCSSLTSVTIPNSVTTIGDSAFNSCSSLTSVTIPNSVTTIGDSAFGGCSALTDITIPDSVTAIGDGAFEYCGSLTSVFVPASIAAIGKNTFLACASLTGVIIPSSVTTIGNSAFSGCSSLSDVYYGGSVLDWGAVRAESDNERLLNANIHFNSTGPSVPVGGVVLSPQKLAVDGKDVDCEKYNIDGSNYFKLRDLAYLLNGTAAQFGVGFDAVTSTVTITTGEAYTPAGGELTAGVDNSANARSSSQTILIDGAKHDDLTAYNIGGSNFFQLRELGNILGFEVDFDTASNTAIVRSK